MENKIYCTGENAGKRNHADTTSNREIKRVSEAKAKKLNGLQVWIALLGRCDESFKFV